MINRSLIRIKTVQILYSYLLVRSDFRLKEAPKGKEASPEEKFAYKVYLSLLYLISKASERPGATKRSRGIPRTIVKGIMDSGMSREESGVIARDMLSLDSLAGYLSSKIMESPVYAEYVKEKDGSLRGEERFWKSVLKNIIEKDSTIESHFRKEENFTSRGFKKGIEMCSESLSSYEYDKSTIQNARYSLGKSLESAYDLYIALLSLPAALTRRQKELYEEAKHKYAPSEEDLNPPTRLVDNLYVAELENHKSIKDYVDSHPQADVENWQFSDDFLDKLLEVIKNSEEYSKYMQSPESGFVSDVKFWRDNFRFRILGSEALIEELEPQSIFWNDDLDIISEFVLKTMKRTEMSEDHKIILLPDFSSKEDEEFGSKLFEDVVTNMSRYRELIDSFINTRSWDIDRIPFMDIVVIMTAMAEMLVFPTIPIAVTLNEYIEIANTYCSPKSGQFVNGILYSVMNKLHSEGILKKELPSGKNEKMSNPK